jgi:hypothetical protein
MYKYMTRGYLCSATGAKFKCSLSTYNPIAGLLLQRGL